MESLDGYLKVLNPGLSAGMLCFMNVIKLIIVSTTILLPL